MQTRKSFGACMRCRNTCEGHSVLFSEDNALCMFAQEFLVLRPDSHA